MKNFIIVLISLIIVSCSKEEELPFYVAQNGVTIKAREWVTVGTTGEINGVTYIAVDDSLLWEYTRYK